MTTNDTIYLIAACAGVLALAAWIGLIVAPAWSSYSRIWERAATFLSLYVLAAIAGVGFAAGLGFLLLWNGTTSV